jgi:hypothetical protein
MKNILTICAAFILGAQVTAQSLKVPTKSPASTIKQGFGLSEVTVEYNRPSARGRIIFGDVVPFGTIWRTGANASTKITFGEDVSINGTKVAAGTYAIFSIPTKDSCTVMLNKNLKTWGTDGYSEADDVVRLAIKSQKITEKVETFTIQFANVKETTMTVEMLWENTKVSFDVAVDVDEKVMKNIESVMAKDSRPYHQAASYYFDNKKDLNKALEWATKSFEMNPTAYWTGLLKAKIQLELKDFKGATATAEQVKKLATADNDPAYIKGAEEVIAAAKKGK